jgi:hypothetical protein
MFNGKFEFIIRIQLLFTIYSIMGSILSIQNLLKQL